MNTVKLKLDLQHQTEAPKNIVLSELSSKDYMQAITHFLDKIDDKIWFQLRDQIQEDLNGMR